MHNHMEELDIIKNIKNNFADRKFLSAFLASLVSFIVIALIAIALVWHFRGNIFSYFAKQYYQEEQTASLDPKSSTGSDTDSQPIFSQDNFVVDAVKKTNPAVVSIIISKEVPKYEEYTDPNQDQTNPF